MLESVTAVRSYGVVKLVAVDDDDILKVKTSRFFGRFPFELFSEDFALEEDADCFTAGADSTVSLLLLGMAPWAVDGFSSSLKFLSYLSLMRRRPLRDRTKINSSLNSNQLFSPSWEWPMCS